MTSAVAARTCSRSPMTGWPYGDVLPNSSGRIALYSRSHGWSSLRCQFGDDGPFLLLELVLVVDPQVAHAVGFDVQGRLPAVGGEVEVVVR